ncbi:MAG: histidine kinase [Gammaproteobacteria bacterium]|nr:histidine kinase [Gammaproteobacteria bacterium]
MRATLEKLNSLINLPILSMLSGLSLAVSSIFITTWSLWFLCIGLALIGLAFWCLWSNYVIPAQRIQNWTQMIRAGDLGAQFTHKPIGDYVHIYQDLQFIGEMLQSLSTNAETQVQKHTNHIAQKTRSLSILYDVANSINLSRDVNSLLSQFLFNMTELIDAQAAVAYLVNDDDEVDLLTHINSNEEIIAEHARHCLINHSSNTQEDGFSILKIKLIDCNDALCKKYFRDEKICILVVPLQYQEKLLGAYNFYVHKNLLNDFEDFDELFTSIGRHLGAAIEKSHLDEETTSLSIMRERTHIANELHDSLAQTLTSIRFQVRVLDETLHQGNDEQTWAEMERIEASINEAHTEIRELIAHFRSPTVLVSLIASVEQTIDRFRQVNDEIQVFFQNEWPETNLPGETEFHILRIIQESLTNIRKHSDAENVRIMMCTSSKDSYKVLIEDDGVGFSKPQTSYHSGEHIGLSIMRDRAKRFGGEFTVESEPGEGTRIVLEFTGNQPSTTTEDQITHEP